MNKYVFYDDVADHDVTICANDMLEALTIIRKDYGPVYLAHMHYYEPEDNHNVVIVGHDGIIKA